MFGRPKLIPKVTEPSELVNKISEFYCDVIADLYDVHCAKFLIDVRAALKEMRRLKYDINQRHKNDFYVDIKYEEPAVRCAYMYAYSVLNTAIVYSEFLKHLKDSEEVLGTLSSKKTMKICCLAGGPATEAVAITKAISDFIGQSSNVTDLLSDVHVTVVDIIPEWESEGESLINFLNKSSSLFTSKSIRFHYSFLKCDLLCPFENALKEKLAEADIITVVKLGSSIEEKSASVCVSLLENMTKNVIECMDEDSCLFMLDVAAGNIFRHMRNTILKEINRFDLQISVCKKYRLLPKTLQKMEACINFRNFSEIATLFPTVFTTITSCFWIKQSVNLLEGGI